MTDTPDDAGFSTVIVPAGFAGIILPAGDQIHMLPDRAPGQSRYTEWLPSLTPIERAVAVARLRGWADALEFESNKESL